jgi:type IX secretion system substrate protein/Big-like domain-containing protein/NHL repeat-containing protein
VNCQNNHLFLHSKKKNTKIMKTNLPYLVSGICLCLFSLVYPLQAQIITTVAGNGTMGFIDGVPATAAELSGPVHLTLDSVGNIYITDQGNQRIRMVNTVGIISTIAGSGSYGFAGDGSAATLAQMEHPYGVAVDAMGNVYFSDQDNYRVRKVSPGIGGIITTIAGTGTSGFFGDGGPATIARFTNVLGIGIDHAGSIYLADFNADRIRKISPATGGIITTIAGKGGGIFGGDGGPATAAELAFPQDVAVDKIGNVYIADNNNQRIRKVDTVGIISTIAGNGTQGYSGDGIPATAAELNGPAGVAVDGCGNVYIADLGNKRVRKIEITGIITTIAGNGTDGDGGDGGPATAGLLSDPSSVKADRKGNIFIADGGNSRVRKISNINRPPYFTAGHSHAFTVCAGSVVSIDSALAVIDSDINQGETWSVWSAPLHGALAGVYTAISTGGKLTPSGLSYTPSGGYSGSDSFKIVISDCADLHDTAVVYMTIESCTLSATSLPPVSDRVAVYPNPNNGQFSLYVSSAAAGDAHIVIRNVMGEKVRDFTVMANNTTEIRLDVSPGIYFCNVITADDSYSRQIIVGR